MTIENAIERAVTAIERIASALEARVEISRKHMEAAVNYAIRTTGADSIKPVEIQADNTVPDSSPEPPPEETSTPEPTGEQTEEPPPEETRVEPDRGELKKFFDGLGRPYNDKVRTATYVKAKAMIEAGAYCEFCLGIGMAPEGGRCGMCNGTGEGVAQEMPVPPEGHVAESQSAILDDIMDVPVENKEASMEDVKVELKHFLSASAAAHNGEPDKDTAKMIIKAAGKAERLQDVPPENYNAVYQTLRKEALALDKKNGTPA